MAEPQVSIRRVSEGPMERLVKTVPADTFEDLMRKYAPGTGGIAENPYREQFLRPGEDIFPETSERPDPAIWPPGQSPEELHGEDIKWREMGSGQDPNWSQAAYGLGKSIRGLMQLDEKRMGSYPLFPTPDYPFRQAWSDMAEHTMLGDYYEGVKQDPETGQWFREKADIYDFGPTRMMGKWYGQSSTIGGGRNPAAPGSEAMSIEGPVLVTGTPSPRGWQGLRNEVPKGAQRRSVTGQETTALTEAEEETRSWMPAWLQNLPKDIRDQATELKLGLLNMRGEPFAQYERTPLFPIEGPYQDERMRLYHREQPPGPPQPNDWGRALGSGRSGPQLRVAAMARAALAAIVAGKTGGPTPAPSQSGALGPALGGTASLASLKALATQLGQQSGNLTGGGTP